MYHHIEAPGDGAIGRTTAPEISHTHEAIAARLAPAKLSEPRRNIMLNLPDDLVERMALLARVLTQLSSQKITRNMLIIDALEVWIAECAALGLPAEAETAAAE